MQISPEVMRADVAGIYEQQQAIGYASTLVEGASDCRAYMLDLFSDWQADGTTAVLHEHRGGYANNVRSIGGLAAKAEAEGVELKAGVRVRGLATDGRAVTGVETDNGRISCDQVVIGVGPWIRDLWAMLDLPARIDVRTAQGEVHHDVPMWRYWMLQEGTLAVDPNAFRDNHGNRPPVMHVDSDAPLHDDEDGSLVTDALWGIYYKPDFSFGGVQGVAAPQRLDRPADEIAIDPYGPESPEFAVGEDFVRMWTSALAQCQKRFEGKRDLYRREPSGGVGAFTPDSFPVFDTFLQNAYVIADANHGYKMIGVGALVAEELTDNPQALLEPFRFSRYSTGKLHPVSHSPFPWS
jgi:glycine/D-amino acid oxidase-like deaminating enzyme